MQVLAEHLSITGGVHSVEHASRELKKILRADRISHLRSIDLDSRFVGAVHQAQAAPPLFANLRCGVWYVPPALRAGCCYFKSTDGHTGRWSFSLSRLNLQAALAAASHGSVMIVDSTRSGKRFPDALSKTVPIWCCVVNRALAERASESATSTTNRVDGEDAAAQADLSTWDCRLWLPEWVPATEASQIERLINGWVAALRRPALAPVLEQLRRELRRPLRPTWCCPADQSYDGAPEWHVGQAYGVAAPSGADSARAVAVAGEAATSGGEPANKKGETTALGELLARYHLVQCVCASAVRSAEASREHHSWTYVQGAGDDEENWACGLKPDQWWQWSARLLELSARTPDAAEEELQRLQAASAVG